MDNIADIPEKNYLAKMYLRKIVICKWLKDRKLRFLSRDVNVSIMLRQAKMSKKCKLQKYGQFSKSETYKMRLLLVCSNLTLSHIEAYFLTRSENSYKVFA